MSQQMLEEMVSTDISTETSTNGGNNSTAEMLAHVMSPEANFMASFIANMTTNDINQSVYDFQSIASRYAQASTVAQYSASTTSTERSTPVSKGETRRRPRVSDRNGVAKILPKKQKVDTDKSKTVLAALIPDLSTLEEQKKTALENLNSLSQCAHIFPFSVHQEALCEIFEKSLAFYTMWERVFAQASGADCRTQLNEKDKKIICECLHHYKTHHKNAFADAVRQCAKLYHKQTRTIQRQYNSFAENHDNPLSPGVPSDTGDEVEDEIGNDMEGQEEKKEELNEEPDKPEEEPQPINLAQQEAPNAVDVNFNNETIERKKTAYFEFLADKANDGSKMSGPNLLAAFSEHQNHLTSAYNRLLEFYKLS